MSPDGNNDVDKTRSEQFADRLLTILNHGALKLSDFT